MDTNPQDLVLEVTRRCNMQCSHCMRGYMQAVDMSEEIVDRVFDNIHYINSITFTGGEPVLNTSIIQYITKRIQEKGIYLASFFCVTNGKLFKREFVDALIDLYSYCESSNGPHEDNYCGLEVSQDQYHESVEIPKIYKALRFFRPDARKEDYRRDAIFNSGIAKLNGLGTRQPRDYGWTFNDADDVGDQITPDMLYIAANGNVYNDCDVSYYRVDKHTYGNVLKTPLVDILVAQRDLQWKKEEVEAVA